METYMAAQRHRTSSRTDIAAGASQRSAAGAATGRDRVVFPTQAIGLAGGPRR